MALASGAKTEKMKFGHHGANHPVRDLESGKGEISSQNHGFAISREETESNNNIEITLFDNSLQGFEIREKYAFGFQGHPEASPGN